MNGSGLVGQSVYASIVVEERNTVALVAAELLPGKAMRLTLERPAGFSFRSGQFVAISVPALGRSAPHPFTISSAPQEQHLHLTIKAVGPWTNRLRDLVLRQLRESATHCEAGGPATVARYRGSSLATIVAARSTSAMASGRGDAGTVLAQLTALAKRGTMDTSFSRSGSGSASADGDAFACLLYTSPSPRD